MTIDARPLQHLNETLRQFLAAPEPADLRPVHGPDDLMVWFLLGGKDVGKSTFLNALFGRAISPDRRDDAEGTARFVAYLHEGQRDELQRRLQGLPIDVDFQLHQSEAHRRLCVIDSPDFDSRFDRHVNQVRRVLQAGVADGAVLLASPAKYKDRQLWQAFEQLAGAISPGHILFALTKADSLGDYLTEVREDFGATVVRRLAAWRDLAGPERDAAPPPAVYLIDSLARRVDFALLEARLLRRLSADEVRQAQQENQLHAGELGAAQLRRHYRLDEFAAELTRAGDQERQAEVFEDHFPAPYFLLLGERLRRREDVARCLRRRLASNAEHTLAGLPTLLELGRWLASWARFRRAALDGAEETEEFSLPPAFFRWGQENLDERLQAARRELLAGLARQWPETAARAGRGEAPIEAELERVVVDELPAEGVRLFAWPWRALLNLPVALYAVFFALLVFYPLFLLLQAWDLFPAPRFAEALTLDNVKLSILGFGGYYLGAAFFVARRRRRRRQQETEAFIRRSLAAVEGALRAAVARTPSRILKEYQSLAGALPEGGGRGDAAR